MDKVLEDVFGTEQSDTDTSTEVTTDNVETEGNPELDIDFSEFEESDEDDESDEDEEEAGTDDFATSKEGNAFASMRVQNAEYKKALDQFDALAKNAGLKDYKEFLDKVKEQSVAKKAKEEGISVELAKKLNEIDEKLETINVKEQNAMYQAKEQKLASTLNTFVKENNMNKASIDKLSKDLSNDGFTLDKLMDMPESAVLKLFGAYTNIGIQKTLDKKSSINQELPVKQTTKVDSQTINKQLDSLVREIMGR